MALPKMKHGVYGLCISHKKQYNILYQSAKITSLTYINKQQARNYILPPNARNLGQNTHQITRNISVSSHWQNDTSKRIIKSPLPDLEIPDDTTLLNWVTRDWWQFGDKTALIDTHTQTKITYNELRDKFTKCGSALARQGFKKGDVITIDLANCIEFPIVYYGALSIGMIVSAVNPAYTAGELRHALNLSESKILVVSPTTVNAAKQALSDCPSLKMLVCTGGSEGCVSLSALLDDDGKSLPENLDIDIKNDVACLPYSSGTTGLPKAVMLTHYSLVANSAQINAPHMINMQRDDIYLCVVPLFHTFGQHVIMILGHHLGATLSLMSAFDPVSYLENIQKYKITYLHFPPPILVFLAKHPLVPEYNFSSIRHGFFGAAPTAPSIINEAKEKMGKDIPLTQGYGMTEASPGIILNPTFDLRPHTVGVPVPNTTVKIRDVQTNELLGPNQDGEICSMGPQTMKGYWKNEQATKETIVDGWLHTGDIGHYDEDGFFTVTDRLKELIKYKGFQVAPAELEDLLLSHPAVQDAAVIGKPDERAGELPRAYVVLKEGVKATEEDIQSFIKDKASDYKQLRGGVEFRAEIPKSPSGKLLRRILKDELKAET